LFTQAKGKTLCTFSDYTVALVKGNGKLPAAVQTSEAFFAGVEALPARGRRSSARHTRRVRRSSRRGPENCSSGCPMTSSVLSRRNKRSVFRSATTRLSPVRSLPPSSPPRKESLREAGKAPRLSRRGCVGSPVRGGGHTFS